MTRPRIAIAHDYLTQRGGAERVVLSMAKAFPDAAIYTTLYDPEGTYPEFADLNIITSGLNRVPLLRRKHRLALPFLASASNHMFVDADLIIASSSGWAHGFAGTGKRLVYCYSPARWLYLTTSYLGDKGHLSVSGMALSLLRPLLIRWDKSKAEQATQYLAISTVVRQRIHDVYGIEAPILAAPLSLDSDRSTEPVDELLDWADGSFHLVVSRLLPYKNVVAVIEAVAGTSQRLVIIEVVQTLLRLMGHAEDDFDHVNDRAGHDLRYAIDSTRLRTELGWAPTYTDFESGLANTVEWYRAHEAWWRPAKEATEAKYQAKGQ